MVLKAGLSLGLCTLALGCGSGAPATAYLNTPVEGTARDYVRDMDVDDLEQGSPSLRLGNMRLEQGVCEGMSLAPAYDSLTAGALATFLREQGYTLKIEVARHDLSYFDVTLPAGGTMRLRVATLASSAEAARDLHEALLEHGRGSWGIHRANLAVLAPIGSRKQIVETAVSTKLACWGVLTVAGRDDVFVVPGGYTEL